MTKNELRALNQAHAAVMSGIDAMTNDDGKEAWNSVQRASSILNTILILCSEEWGEDLPELTLEESNDQE